MQSTSQDSAKSASSPGPQALGPSIRGLELQSGPRALTELVELLSSMRFAISALAVVCVASAIGTIVQQNAPPINYVNQFGAFWSEVFTLFDLFRVYNAPWFLLVMMLMLTSTSLCLLRNAPRMVKEARAWREHVRDSAFPAFRHRSQSEVQSPKEVQERIDAAADWMSSRGYRLRRFESSDARPVLVAKKGSSNRLGYIAAHLAIVVISVGGLLDSELPTRLAMWWWDKAPIALESVDGSAIPSRARLPETTPTYRANLLLPEGQRSDLAVVSQPKGALLLDLPFDLELKTFRVEYYATGMPKLFASDVRLTDKQTGQVKEATIEVNKPLIHRGIAIYQSSFDDGGSRLKLLVQPLRGGVGRALPLEMTVGSSLPLKNASQTLALELTQFKPINVENMGPGRDVQAGFQAHVASVFSPAVNNDKTKTLSNVGPAIHYKLRDSAGQAKEFHSYMQPVKVEEASVFLIGVRNSPDESFQYLRIPADEHGSMQEFLRIRSAIDDPEMRRRAALIFAQKSAPQSLQPALSASAQRALEALSEGGLTALAGVLERTVPEDQRERAADVVVRMLTASFWEAWQLARQRDGLPRVADVPANQEFAQRALNAFSDSRLFSAPFIVTLTDYDEVKASVFQVTRSPGQPIVYLGCLLLVVGIFAMLYIRESRVWIWTRPTQQGVSLLLAASSPRESMDFDREFSELSGVLQSQQKGLA